MSTTRTVDYAVENRRGVVVRTFGDPFAARKWASAHEDQHDGLVVVEVTTTVMRRPVLAGPAPRGDTRPSTPLQGAVSRAR